MKTIKYLAIATMATALSSSLALAHPEGEHSKDQQAMRDWAKMRAEAVPAGEIIAGDVSNLFNPVGQTKDLILNEEGTAVQYVLFESPHPYSLYSSEDGFVNWDAVDLDDDFIGGVDLVIKDAEVSLPRDKLTITRGEARHRMLSRLIGSDIEFSDGEVREVEEILIHPKTGMVTHYVVEMNPEAWFDEDLRTVRSSNVTIKNDGKLNATLKIADVDAAQDYDSDFL